MIQPISISFDQLNILTIMPMAVAIFGALTILVIDLFTNKLHKSFFVMLTILFLMIDLGVVLTYTGNPRGFFDLMLVDGISLLSQIIILVGSGLFILLALSQSRFHEYRYPEYFALFLFMIAGFQFMVSSDSLILIFVGLETASMSIYTIIAMHNRTKSIEAAIKYFTIGALATAFFAFGSMILYGVTGTVELGRMAEVFVSTDFANYPYILLGVVFIASALGFKLSLVPFHIWTPDVYEGSSAALAGFLSIVPKIAGFVVVLRFFEVFVLVEDMFVHYLLYGLVVVTITVPNMIALVQTDIKRMLAYSSISHAGFALSAVLVGTTQATNGLFLYWIMFLFTNIGAFAILWVHRRKKDKKYGDGHPFEKFAGLIKTSPVAASIMGLFMLSLAGVPPFSLFWGKMYLIGATISGGELVLAVIMALNSGIAVYYYLKLIVYMFLKDKVEDSEVVLMGNANTTLKAVIGISAIATTISVLFIDRLLELINYYVTTSGF